jgi:flagellar basal body rod protein FlgC
MLSVNASLSALMAYGRRMGVHASNVANMYSQNFNKSRVVMKEGPGQAVTAEIEPVDPQVLPREGVGELDCERAQDAAETPQTDALTGYEHNNVELAEEMVGTIISQNAYSANLKMVAAQDEMIGSVLDICK